MITSGQEKVLTKINDYSTMIMVMQQQTVSKSQFKAQALEFLRNVEKTKIPLVITHGGKPVIDVIPHKEDHGSDPEAILKSLRGTLIYYKDPTEPVGLEDWEVLK